MTAVVVLLLQACASQVPEPVPAHESFDLASTVLGESRKINVYLPPDYAGSAQA